MQRGFGMLGSAGVDGAGGRYAGGTALAQFSNGSIDGSADD